jgi:hypothetical protein
MRFPVPPSAALLLLLAALAQGQDMTLLLKQAADGLLVNSLPGFAAKPGGAAAAQLPPARVGQPGPGDLAIRRLQVRLALLVEDRWKDLTDSQRWAILQTQGQIQHQITSTNLMKRSVLCTSYDQKCATEV